MRKTFTIQLTSTVYKNIEALEEAVKEAVKVYRTPDLISNFPADLAGIATQAAVSVGYIPEYTYILHSEFDASCDVLTLTLDCDMKMKITKVE